MQILYGNSADVSFPAPNTVGDVPYAGPLTAVVVLNLGRYAVSNLTIF